MSAKRLIVIFVAIALLVSMAAFILPAQFSKNSSEGSNNPFYIADSGGSGSDQGNSAFAQNSQVQNGAFSPTAYLDITGSPDNLTNALTDQYANVVIADNPNGPTIDANGNQLLNLPTEDSVASNLASSSAYEDIQIPNWDANPILNDLKITNDTSATATTQYGNDLADAINKYFVSSNLNEIVNNPASGSDTSLASAASEINGAINSVTGITTPKSLADLQRSLARVLIYDSNGLALTQNASADPIKASVIMEAEQVKFNDAQIQLENALQSAMANPAFSVAFEGKLEASNLAMAVKQNKDQQNASIAFVNNLLGIKTADALFGIVFDPIQTAKEIGQAVWEWTQQTLLQIAKDELVSQFEDHVEKLIYNSGDPLVVQQFGPFVQNAFDISAGAAANSIIPGLCGNYKTNVGQWLQQALSTAKISPGPSAAATAINIDSRTGTYCDLQNLNSNHGTSINSITFYNDFNVTGAGISGINGFAHLLSPNGNPYSAFGNAFEAAQEAGDKQAQVAQLKLQTSGGYKGQQTCGNNGSSTTNSVCPNGTEPTIKTPASTISNLSNQGLTKKLDFAANANNLVAGITETLAESLINKTIFKGTGLLSNVPIGATTVSNPPLPPISCNAVPDVASTSQRVEFTAFGVNGSSDSFSWTQTGGDQLSLDSNQSTFDVMYDRPGNYSATVKDTIILSPGSTTPSVLTATCSVTIQ